MRRLRVLHAFTFAVGIVACTWVSAGDATKPAAKEWQVLPVLPEDTIAAISIRDASAAYERLQRTGLWRILSHPGVEQAFDAPLQNAKGKLKLVEQQIGHKLEDLLKTVKGEVTFGILGLLDQQNEKGEPIPDLVLAVQPRDQATNWMDKWDRFVAELNAKTENTIKFTESVFEGASVVTLSHEASPVRIIYTLADGVFLASFGPGRIENILASRKVAAAEGGAKPAPKTLAATPAFQSALQKAGGTYDAMVYVGVQKIRDIPQIGFNPKNDRERGEWASLGLQSVRAVSYCLSFQGAGIQETLFVDAPSTDRTGLLKMIGGGTGALSALGKAPRGSLIAAAMKSDPQTVLDQLIETVALTDPNARQEADKMLNKIGQTLNLDVKKDLLGALTGEMVLSLSVPTRHPKIRFGFPRPVLSLGVKDRDSAMKALSGVRQVVEKELHFLENTHRGQTITMARAKKGKEPGQLCWALVKDRVVISLFPLALQDEIDRLLRESPESLAQESDFQSTTEHVASDSQAMIYFDTGAIATAAYDFLIPLAQFQKKIPGKIQVLLLPPVEELTRHMKGTCLALNADDRGVRLQGFSSTGLWTTLLPTAGIIGDNIKKRQRRKQARAHGGQPPQAGNKGDQPKGDPVPPPTPPPDF